MKVGEQNNKVFLNLAYTAIKLSVNHSKYMIPSDSILFLNQQLEFIDGMIFHFLLYWPITIDVR